MNENIEKILSEIPTEILRKELRKRSNQLRKEKRANREPYRYAELTIHSIYYNEKNKSIYNDIYFTTESLFPDAPLSCQFRLCQKCGFKRDNTPNVGDTVIVRAKNYANQKNNKFAEWKISAIKQHIMKTPEQIITWLKENNFWDKFSKEYNNYPESYMPIDKFIEQTYAPQIIGEAFKWNDTQDGAAFWNNVDDQFTKWVKG